MYIYICIYVHNMPVQEIRPGGARPLSSPPRSSLYITIHSSGAVPGERFKSRCRALRIQTDGRVSVDRFDGWRVLEREKEVVLAKRVFFLASYRFGRSRLLSRSPGGTRETSGHVYIALVKLGITFGSYNR